MKRKAKNRLPMPQRPASPIKPSPNRETLTYAQAQRIVELEIDGHVHRISIFDKLQVLSEVDPAAQEIIECSSRENNEKPQQVLVRSVRLKNNQQKKIAADIAAKGAQASGNPLREPKIRTVEYNLPMVPRRPSTYYTYEEKTAEELDEEVEYDMDEEDYAWLELINEKRKSEGFSPVSQNVFEFLMDRLEKESFFDSHGQREPQPLVDEDAVCCVCVDGECHDSNAILFCDACNLAVHQECYGVPYIPEGQWLCRPCQQSSSQPVDCILCPNKGGALKKTDDGRWGHVACAMWVPEVGFTSAVFVEPIDGVHNIPPARWKLTCYLCKEKGVGACIQCDRQNCYTAFHVSCAQKAGLYMKMEPIKDGAESGTTTFSVKKTAYCGNHTPSGCIRRPLAVYHDVETKNAHSPKGHKVNGKLTSKGSQKKKKKQKDEPEVVAAAPLVSMPSIPSQRLNNILNQVSMQRKRAFLERILSYWILKRQARNGVPLLRRLQSAPQSQKTSEPAVQKQREEESEALKEQLKDWHRLRHDLERTRLLLELIRKREKIKREEIKLQQAQLEVELTPFAIFLRGVLDMLQQKDQARIFAEPVSIKEVPDYLDHIKQPMDFSTMRKRVDAQDYRSLDDFQADFDLIVANCMKYNSKDTFFYRAAVRLQDQGGAVLRKACRQAEGIGFDYASGLHLTEAPKVESVPPFSWEDVDWLLDPTNRARMSLEEQLRELLEKLDLTRAMKCCPSRSKRLKLLKKVIFDIRNEMSLQQLGASGTESSQPVGADLHLEKLDSEDGEKSLPPDLEPSHSFQPTPVNACNDTEPPTLKLEDPDHENKAHKHVKFNSHGKSDALDLVSVLGSDLANGHSPPLSPVPSSDLSASPTTPAAVIHTHISRRTAVLFRKSKSVSPQKPKLGTKTILSVVIPRLETLLQPRKRSRSASGDSQVDEPPPIKRFDTGMSNGFVVEEEMGVIPRHLEPRRRCASESSISSSGSLLCSTSVSLPKSGKCKPGPVRRNTVDDRNGLISRNESGNFAKATRISADNRPQDASGGLPSQWALHSDAPAGRAPGRRADAVQVRREALPRPLLRQQAQLAMAS